MYHKLYLRLCNIMVASLQVAPIVPPLGPHTLVQSPHADSGLVNVASRERHGWWCVISSSSHVKHFSIWLVLWGSHRAVRTIKPPMVHTGKSWGSQQNQNQFASQGILKVGPPAQSSLPMMHPQQIPQLQPHERPWAKTTQQSCLQIPDTHRLCCCCLVAKLCLTLLRPMDCSPPGSSVHGISQARILEWVAISFSRGSSRPRDQTHIFCITGGFFTTEPPGKPCDYELETYWGHIQVTRKYGRENSL